MKRTICGLLAVSLLVFCTPAMADTPSLSMLKGAGEKFLRGAANLTTGWLELGKQPYRIGKEQGYLLGATFGVFDGLGMFIGRTLAGAYEVLTFPVPIPPGYQRLLEPDFVWEEDQPSDGARG